MHLKGFHRVVLPSILVAFLYCVSAVEEYECPYNIHVKKGQIIKAGESVGNGAAFLKHSAVSDARECYKLCCERKHCDLAQMQYKNSSADGFFVQIEKICYMFHCGIPSKCSFGEHDHYATISYERPDEKLSNLEGGHFEIPSKRVNNKPKWNGKTQHSPSASEGDNEDKDLGSEPYRPPSSQKAMEQKEHKDLHSSWKTKSKEENVDYSDKLKQYGKPTYHSKNTKEPTKSKTLEETEPPVYQEVVTKKQETPTKHKEVRTKGPVIAVQKVTEKQKAMQPPTQKELDEADAELEMKLEELTPPEKPSPARVTPPTTFHHWREFVDNNPNFPYTIPVNPKKPTPKLTTKQWNEQPTTDRHTTLKTTTRKTVKTVPRKTTEKTTTTKKAIMPHEDNTHGNVAQKPPVLELPLPHKNVSDVVVIETRRLKIIENKAVLPLAIFLVLAILLLFVVALRLRIVKSKLKRRPFATDDADYLINGMYL